MIIHQADKGKVKGLRRVTGSHRSCFTDEKPYGTEYTPRQQAIIDCEYVPNLNRGEISKLINKSRVLGDYEQADMLFEMYSDILMYNPKTPSKEEVDEARTYLDKIKEEVLK